MFHALSQTLAAVGLVLVLFTVRIRTRSSSVVGLLPSQSASPLKDPASDDHLESDTSSTNSPERDANYDTDKFWHCGSSPKLMTIEVNDSPTDAGSAKGWKHYATVPWSEKWENTNITYSVFNYANFPREKVLAILRRALQRWSDAAPRLRFKRIKDNARKANMRIRFADGDFEDPEKYGSRVIAHAFFPDEAAERMLEFRQDKPWTMNKIDGYNLLIVATHEFGHALGLYHSEVKEAIMYEYVKFIDVKGCNLHDDDIQAIQSLYGGPTSSTSTPSIFRRFRNARPVYSSDSSSDDYTRVTKSTGAHSYRPYRRRRMTNEMRKLLSLVTRRLSHSRVIV